MEASEPPRRAAPPMLRRRQARHALLQGRRRNAPSLKAAWHRRGGDGAARGGVVAPRLPFAYVTLTNGSPRAALVYMVYALATYIL